MALHRNILTSPEEPAGRSRAYPQEVWASYLLGNQLRGAGGHASPSRAPAHFLVRLPGMASGLDCAKGALCPVAWAAPHSRYSAQGLVVRFVVSASSRSALSWPISFDCK